MSAGLADGFKLEIPHSEGCFFDFMELEPNGQTLGERVIPQMESGRLALMAGGSDGD